MSKFQSTANKRLVWPTIQRPDGTTLELDPGEVVELDIPPGFIAPSLVCLSKKLTKKESEKQAVQDYASADVDTPTNEEPKS